MGVVAPETAAKLFSAIEKERQEQIAVVLEAQQKLQAALDSAQALAQQAADEAVAAGIAEVNALVNEATLKLDEIVTQPAVVNSNPEEPNATPVDEAASEVVSEIQAPAETPVEELPEGDPGAR